MKILVLNSGSSSIKYQLFDMQPDATGQVRAAGLVERIGEESSGLKYSRLTGDSPVTKEWGRTCGGSQLGVETGH